jgi:hypothetical protein
MDRILRRSRALSLAAISPSIERGKKICEVQDEDRFETKDLVELTTKVMPEEVTRPTAAIMANRSRIDQDAGIFQGE